MLPEFLSGIFGLCRAFQKENGGRARTSSPPFPLCERGGPETRMSRNFKENCIRKLLTGVAFVSLLSLACIMLFLFMEGLPLFADYPLWSFLSGTLWYPTSDPPEFGILSLIVGRCALLLWLQ